MNLSPHSATTRNVAGIYPLLASPTLPESVYIGVDKTTGASFCWDPFTLYRTGHLRGPNAILLGQIGLGKSSLTKCIVGRGALHGRKAFIISPKPGEYDLLAASIGAELVRLEPGGTTRVNPLTGHGTVLIEQLSRLVAIAEAILGRVLTPRERACCRTVLTDIHGQGEVTVPKLAESPGWDDAEDVRFALEDLCVGELAGMFDGPTTSGLRLDGHVILDLGALWNSSALAVAMVAAAGWMRAIVNQKDQHPRYLIVDEAWRALASAAGAEMMQTFTKNSRGLGISNLLVVHKLADLEVAGDKGSRVQGIVANLLADMETRVIFRQPPDQVEATARLLGLTDTEAARLPDLDIGEALWKVGSRSFIVVHKRSSMEKTITNTDARMVGEVA